MYVCIKYKFTHLKNSVCGAANIDYKSLQSRTTIDHKVDAPAFIIMHSSLQFQVFNVQRCSLPIFSACDTLSIILNIYIIYFIFLFCFGLMLTLYYDCISGGNEVH